MIKDIVVNLPVDGSRDVVTAFSASVAATLEAHLSGVALIYDPLVPMMADMYGVPPDLIETQRVQNRKAAKASVQGFMGGYGHSRLREFVLGGVTRSILAAMTLPTLMSH